MRIIYKKKLTCLSKSPEVVVFSSTSQPYKEILLQCKFIKLIFIARKLPEKKQLNENL